MKYVKMLGLLAVAAAALMAFAGTASATELTSSTGSTPHITATAGTTELHAGDSKSFLSVACHSSSVAGTVESHGGSNTAKGNLVTLSFSNCTNGTVTVVNKGNLEVHKDTSTGDGILTSTGAEILIHTSSGPTCTAKTNATQVGTLTGSASGHAVLDIASSTIPLSGFLCPSTGVWTGNYTVNHPTGLTVHN